MCTLVSVSRRNERCGSSWAPSCSTSARPPPHASCPRYAGSRVYTVTASNYLDADTYVKHDDTAPAGIFRDLVGTSGVGAEDMYLWRDGPCRSSADHPATPPEGSAFDQNDGRRPFERFVPICGGHRFGRTLRARRCVAQAGASATRCFTPCTSWARGRASASLEPTLSRPV